MNANIKYFFYNMLSKILPKQFYRVSVKALIWNIDKTKFLLLQEASGYWETPGGGLDWGEDPVAGVSREVVEETGFEVIRVLSRPVCFLTAPHHRFDGWFANVVYEVEVKDAKNIVKNEECVAIDWVTPEEAVTRTPAFNSVKALGEALLRGTNNFANPQC